jgi:hypothetical protein
MRCSPRRSHVFNPAISKQDVDARDKPGHDAEMASCLFDSVSDCRRLAQTVAAQAVVAPVHRHRQAHRFLGAPARPRRAAGEFRTASGTGKPARDWII